MALAAVAIDDKASGDPEPASAERLPAGVRRFLPFASSATHVQELLRLLETSAGRGQLAVG